MPSSAIPSIEAPVAGSPVRAATAPTGASGEDSVFGGLIHEILQRGDAVSDAVSAQAASANGPAPTNGAPGASGNANWTAGESSSETASDATGLSPSYASSVKRTASGANGTAAAPDNPTVADGAVASQTVAALRSAVLDLAVGKNGVPTSTVLEGLADSVAANESVPNGPSDGKPGENASTSSAIPAKPSGATRGATNSSSSSRPAVSAIVLLAAPLGVAVFPPQAALPLAGAANSSARNGGGANVDLRSADRNDAPVYSNPDSTLATAAAALEGSFAQKQPGTPSLAGLSFASTLTSATAGETSTTTLAAAGDAGTPTNTTHSAVAVSNGTTQPTVEQESASVAAGNIVPATTSAELASQAIAEAAAQVSPTFAPAAAIPINLPAEFAALIAEHETPAGDSGPASTNGQQGSRDVSIAGKPQIGVQSLVPPTLPVQAARSVQSPAGLDIRAAAVALPKTATGEPDLQTVVKIVGQTVAQKDATLTGFIHAAPLSTEALSTITHPTDATSFASAPASLPGATHGVAAQGGASTAASGSANPPGNANSEQQPAYQADAAISNAPGTGKNGATRGPDTPASDSGPAGIFALTSSPGIGNAAAASIVTVNAAAAAGQAATIAASTAALAVPFAAHGAGSATTSAQPSATVPDSPATQTAATPTLPASADAAARGGFVTSAQLVQSGTHSEMRVSLQSDNLGSVELHARVSGDSVGAAITVEKRDAHTMLATELPVLQQALSDKQLRVEQITVLHAPMSSASGDAAANQFGGAGQGQTSGRGTQNPVGGAFGATALSGFPFATGFNTDAGEIFDAQGRLSVHA